MLKENFDHLDYQKLYSLGRKKIAKAVDIRIAVCGDVSTQHFSCILKGLAREMGLEFDIYEVDFGAAELEAFNPTAELYKFKPDFILILQSPFRFKEQYYHLQDKSQCSKNAHARVVALWDAFRSQSNASIIQSNFVVLNERSAGNYSALLPQSLQHETVALNIAIVADAKMRSSVSIADLEMLSSWVGKKFFLDEKMHGIAKIPCSLDYLPHFAQQFLDMILTNVGRSIKCVVLDLDNTLWGGVIGDDGIDGIGLGDLDEGHAFFYMQSFMKELFNRGIILAVCSKNTESIARNVFQNHPDMVLREEHISCFVANWDDKAANIRKIQQTLNIGFDSMVFIDDNPFERNLVRQLLPQILVPELPEDPSEYVRFLNELNLFEAANITSEDTTRTQSYQQQQQRVEEQTKFVSLDDYLISLNTTATIRPFESSNISRVAQLIQRSNQFNLTTRRYSEAECHSLASDPASHTLTIQIKDKFGDFGLILVSILRIDKVGDQMEIDSFLMSCRVLQRGVEKLAMNEIIGYARTCGLKRLIGRYIPTAKNVMVKSFYESFGFHLVEECSQGHAIWALDINDDLDFPHTIVTE